MRYLSVCSGIEAASVAWHPLRWTPVAFSEIEPFPAAVLAHHYPNVPNWGDMTKFKEWPDATFNVLVGGTPCQSFSVAGLRKGLTDPRGNLMLVYGAIAARYRPAWLVWENVTGVLSSNGGRDFGTFLGMLAELGYGFAYRVLDAQYVRVESFSRAVPQRRRRVFVIGHLGSWQRAAAVLFECDSLSGNPAPSRKTGEGVAGNVAACLRSGGDGGVPSSRGENLVAKCFQQNTRDEVRYINGDGSIAGALAAESGAKQTNATNVHSVCYPINTMAAIGRENEKNQRQTFGIGEDGDPKFTLQSAHSHAVCVNTRQDPIHDSVSMPLGAKDNGHGVQVQWASGGGQMENDTAQALRSGAEHNYQFVRQQTQVRRLLLTECEALQGFPRNYTNIPWRNKPEAPDRPRYKALGNSMAVNCMRWIGERIQMVEGL